VKKIPKKLGRLNVTRSALRHYALYRRHSLLTGSCDAVHLEAFHMFESTGQLPEGQSAAEYRRSNGWANGKWALKVTSETIDEDIRAGHFCKAEFYAGACGWYWRVALDAVPARELFGWRARP